MSYAAGGFVRGILVAAALALLGQACGGRMDNPQSLDVGATSGGSPEFSTGGGISYIVASGGAIAAGGTVHFVTAPVLASGGSALFLCGNRVLDPGEGCDDGNTAAEDGCGATCQIESWDPCSSALCTMKIVCGDGVLGVGEECDDGNLNNGDGCSQNCKVEPGY